MYRAFFAGVGGGAAVCGAYELGLRPVVAKHQRMEHLERGSVLAYDSGTGREVWLTKESVERIFRSTFDGMPKTEEPRDASLEKAGED